MMWQAMSVRPYPEGGEGGAARIVPPQEQSGVRQPGSYTRPLLSST